MLDSIFNLSNILTVLVTAAATWGGTFLFHRQKKDEMQIANEAARSQEWRNLYEESQRDSARKDKKLDELREEINQLRSQLIELERQVQLNTVFRCDRMDCPKRNPPLKDAPVGHAHKHHPATVTDASPSDLMHSDAPADDPQEPTEYDLPNHN